MKETSEKPATPQEPYQGQQSQVQRYCRCYSRYLDGLPLPQQSSTYRLEYNPRNPALNNRYSAMESKAKHAERYYPDSRFSYYVCFPLIDNCMILDDSYQESPCARWMEGLVWWQTVINFQFQFQFINRWEILKYVKYQIQNHKQQIKSYWG